MIRNLADFILVSGFVVIGAWLEGIGGKNGLVDRFLTPLPLGFTAIALVFLKWRLA